MTGWFAFSESMTVSVRSFAEIFACAEAPWAAKAAAKNAKTGTATPFLFLFILLPPFPFLSGTPRARPRAALDASALTP
ncbi:MAG: hypothetical protein A2Z99_17835 [Treponema sp. GWB1_62_6]|nr:MAG: hypothetical protein A2001_16390 [Treponema sp. GWC1_61_84]OHE65038.1 MAG: hypothetical protein A2Z99_17835 [Treponema sp. GWB1_62_6]